MTFLTSPVNCHHARHIHPRCAKTSLIFLLSSRVLNSRCTKLCMIPSPVYHIQSHWLLLFGRTSLFTYSLSQGYLIDSTLSNRKQFTYGPYTAAMGGWLYNADGIASLKTGKYSDYLITCKGFEFKVHKLVLSSSSKFFEVCIDGEFKV